jgi:hypothetical protein
MQLTNLQVLNALQGLNALGQQKLPIKLAWKITTAVRALETFAKAVDEPMKEIRTKYAIKDADGNFVPAVDENGKELPDSLQIPNDKVAIVNKELNELLDQVVEVHNVTIKLSHFPDNCELEPAVLNALSAILELEPATELKLVP